MNQELKQRLIGAVVVTALAAIFIPMLFDDPIDKSGQKVSELDIPATPISTGVESANKLPTGTDQVLNRADSESETVVNTEEEAELAAGQQAPANELLEGETAADAEAGIDEPENDRASVALDTGVADNTNKPVKKSQPTMTRQTAKAKPSAAATVNKSVDKSAKASSDFKRWTVQAGSFSKKENALSRMEAIRKLGLPVTMESTKGLYRLKVGPTLDKKRAAEMKAKLHSQNIQSIIIAE